MIFWAASRLGISLFLSQMLGNILLIALYYKKVAQTNMSLQFQLEAKVMNGP